MAKITVGTSIGKQSRKPRLYLSKRKQYVNDGEIASDKKRIVLPVVEQAQNKKRIEDMMRWS